MDTASRLSVQVSKLTAYALVTVTGAVERETRPVLIHHLSQALRMTRIAVIVDMSAVDYCDFSGLSAIAHTFRQADPPAPSIVLVDPTERLRRALSVTALEPVYAHGDLETAVRWLETGNSRRPAVNGSRTRDLTTPFVPPDSTAAERNGRNGSRGNGGRRNGQRKRLG